MSRIRTIKPEFPQSETIGRLSRSGRLLFVQLWTIADDLGRARASSRMLASLLYPYDDDAPELIDTWLAELEGEGCIRRYAVEGKLYLDIPKWLEHQKIDHPSKSKLPEFRETLASPRDTLAPDLGPSTSTLKKDSSLRSESKETEKAEFEKTKKGRKPSSKVPLPSDFQPELLPTEIPEFQRFKDSALAHDRHYANWDAAWRNWKSSPYNRGNGDGTSRQAGKPPSAITAAVDDLIRQFDRNEGGGGEVRQIAPRLLSNGRR